MAASELERWCSAHLGLQGECFRCELSVGIVFGVQLEDERRVAVKAHSRSLSRAQLEEIQLAQHRLAEAGFPCPRPLAGPATFLATLALAEEWLDGAPGDWSRRTVAASGKAFAQHVALLRELAPKSALPRTMAGGWPPKPHNALFDFTRDRAGAAWIDAIALRARERLDVGEFVLGHSDWSAKHVAGDEVCATYDWDSLRRERMPVLSGFAAACHHVDLDPEDPWRAEPERVRAYLDELELPRGEREAALAAAVYLFAYTARCEHGFSGVPTVTRMRETLRDAASDLLGPA